MDLVLSLSVLQTLLEMSDSDSPRPGTSFGGGEEKYSLSDFKPPIILTLSNMPQPTKSIWLNNDDEDAADAVHGNKKGVVEEGDEMSLKEAQAQIRQLERSATKMKSQITHLQEIILPAKEKMIENLTKQKERADLKESQKDRTHAYVMSLLQSKITRIKVLCKEKAKMGEELSFSEQKLRDVEQENEELKKKLMELEVTCKEQAKEQEKKKTETEAKLQQQVDRRKCQ